MALITNVGRNCLVCNKDKAAIRALTPIIVKGKVIEPHTYAVCEMCYRVQWAEVNGELVDGKDYDHFLEDKRKLYDERGRLLVTL